jgi:hypothetical protein
MVKLIVFACKGSAELQCNTGEMDRVTQVVAMPAPFGDADQLANP